MTHSLDIDKRSSLVVDKLSCELGSVIGVDASDVLEERGIVGGVVDALRVDDDLGELTRLGEAGDDLVGNVCAKVDGQSESHVVGADDVSQLLTALDLFGQDV